MMRITVCGGLIVLSISQTSQTFHEAFGEEAFGETYDNSGKANASDGSRNRLPLNSAETPPNDMSRAVKDAAYRLNTGVNDFGDHKIETNAALSDILVIAIHGGKIESGTTELAYALASRNRYNYYSYLGVKATENSRLHVVSEEFAEPAALNMVSLSEATLSIHGCGGTEEFTYVGGRDSGLADKVRMSLKKYGFTVLEAPANLAGLSPANIVNKNKKGAGVQLELSWGLRAQLLSADGALMERYVLALSEAVESMEKP
jgi:phage replication-related protein YjqB (UPF0714/DUF867 family)